MDLQSLLAPVSDDSPCGEDLEYDAAFLELGRIAEGQPERQMGDAIIAAEDPDWRAVRELATELLGRSKDLRIAIHLSHALTALEGIAGLAKSLEFIAALISTFWDRVYPQLDPDDDNDPTIRINVLSALAAAEPMLRLVRASVIVRSRGFGPISLRAALAAEGLLTASNETLSQEQLAASLRDADAESLSLSRTSIAQAMEGARAIEKEVADKVGITEGVDLGPVRALLKQAAHILGEEPVVASEEAPDETGESATAGSATTTAPRIAGEIRNREDVQLAFEKILKYYAQNEPSSPVPVLIKRAEKLVNADFSAIIKNLLPDGMSQLERLRGPEDDD